MHVQGAGRPGPAAKVYRNARGTRVALWAASPLETSCCCCTLRHPFSRLPCKKMMPRWPLQEYTTVSHHSDRDVRQHIPRGNKVYLDQQASAETEQNCSVHGPPACLPVCRNSRLRVHKRFFFAHVQSACKYKHLRRSQSFVPQLKQNRACPRSLMNTVTHHSRQDRLHVAGKPPFYNQDTNRGVIIRELGKNKRRDRKVPRIHSDLQEYKVI